MAYVVIDKCVERRCRLQAASDPSLAAFEELYAVTASTFSRACDGNSNKKLTPDFGLLSYDEGGGHLVDHDAQAESRYESFLVASGRNTS